jgi:hypothetical protein
MRDAGCNIAYWNLPERRLQVPSAGVILVNGAPARFFHFSGFEPEHPSVPSKFSPFRWDGSFGEAGAIYKQYAEMLMAAGHDSTSRTKYGFDYFDNGAPISSQARDLYKALGATAADFGDPFQTNRPDSFFRWLSDNHPEATQPSGPSPNTSAAKR